VSFGAGRFAVSGDEHGIGLLALAEAARDPANLPDGMTPGLTLETGGIDLLDLRLRILRSVLLPPLG
jgi:carbon-monoxide dehydrogenase large subunit